MKSILVLSIMFLSVTALADPSSCSTETITTTYSLPCLYGPGTPVNGCVGFTQTDINSVEFQAQQSAQAQYGRQNVFGVTVGQCNYVKETMGSFYCDINVLVQPTCGT